MLTANQLSLNNLMTKKARTLLTAFAGSIGIIGIALILSVSSGFQRYIDKLEEDTLSSYPLQIQSETADMTSMITAFAANAQDTEGEESGETTVRFSRGKAAVKVRGDPELPPKGLHAENFRIGRIRQLALGTVAEVHVPDPECEAGHDVSRALADSRDDVVACKQRLSKMLLRYGYVYDEVNARGQRKNTWTKAHWTWIESIELAEKAAQEALDYYIDRCKRAIEEKRELEEKVKAHAEEARWKPEVDALKCLKGIDAVTAFALVVEVDGFSRFRNASAFASWLGLVPSENSSADSRRQGGITKAARGEEGDEGAGGRTGGPQARREGRAPACRQARRLARRGQEIRSRQLRHGARARVLGMGDRLHGGGRVEGAANS